MLGQRAWGSDVKSEIRSTVDVEGHCREARAARAADAGGRRAAVRAPRSARSGGPGQSRARAATRRPDLLQLQHSHRSDERLRGELPVLLVRAAAAGRSRFLHDVARRRMAEAARAPRSAAHRSARRQRPASRLAVRVLPRDASGLQTHPSRDSPEVFYGCGDRVLRRSLRHDGRAGTARADGRGARVAARRGSRGVRRACAAENLPRQGGRQSMAVDPSHRARSGHEVERHDAVRPHRDERRAGRSHAARPRAAGRDGRLSGVHPAGVSSRQQPDAQAACADRFGHAARARRVAAHARQHPARESVLDCDRRRAGADGAVVWRRRSRRHRAGREDLPHGGIAHARGADDARHRAHHPRAQAARPSSATRSTTSCGRLRRRRQPCRTRPQRRRKNRYN